MNWNYEKIENLVIYSREFTNYENFPVSDSYMAHDITLQYLIFMFSSLFYKM